MKSTKIIKDLAIQINNSDSYTPIDYATSTLNDFKQALLNGRYYTRVESVSKSGMSRVIKIGYIKNNKFYNAPDFIYKMAGCDKNNRINGCGMDVLFSAQYNIFTTLFSRKTRYQDKMKAYNQL